MGKKLGSLGHCMNVRKQTIRLTKRSNEVSNSIQNHKYSKQNHKYFNAKYELYPLRASRHETFPNVWNGCCFLSFKMLCHPAEDTQCCFCFDSPTQTVRKKSRYLNIGFISYFEKIQKEMNANVSYSLFLYSAFYTPSIPLK